MIYHVNANSLPFGDGSAKKPFRTIQEAADAALPGDEVLVHPGVYREWVKPRRAGTPSRRIIYRSAVKGAAVITGAESIKNWSRGDGGVWTVSIPNSMFTDRNPFTTPVSGDWLIPSQCSHTGDVYLDGKSMYEASGPEGVLSPAESPASWEPEFSTYTWFAQLSEDGTCTEIMANFHDLDPNDRDVEISVRKHCFWPADTGVGYITVCGFRICKAATQWAPPTAYQEGMIGPNWSKGWIIEDCDISESKCSGISLGKYFQPANDNKWLKQKFKDGTQTERDCICQARSEGWTRDNVGSHTVRRCEIHHCGQTGIVGHLGGVFSVIEDNHIHHINNKQNLSGAEIGGIKMHAAIDVVFRRNHIHHCTRGLWLDWQAQGTRVTGNLFHDNALPFPYLMRSEALGGYGEDIFVEVSHGPTLIDNNLLLSVRSLRLATQGCAFVHNLIAGSISAVGRGVENGSLSLPSPRYTPYHAPHSTDIAGFMSILHGDMRFYNNVFVQQKVDPFLVKSMEDLKDDPWDEGNVVNGLHVFDFCPEDEEWLSKFEGYCGMGSPASDRYYVPLPVWAAGNVYFNGARPWRAEQGSREDVSHPVSLSLTERGDGWYLETDIGELLSSFNCEQISTATLGEAFEPEQRFEAPDGSDIVFDRDFFSRPRGCSTLPGPFCDTQWDGLMVDPAAL